AGQPQAVPGDMVQLTAQATNTGTSLDLRGRVDARNAGTSTFTVRGFRETLEYFSASQQAWVVVASYARDNNNNVLPAQPPQLQLQLASLDALGGTGVTPGTDVIFGTQIAVGATAQWLYHWVGVLPPETVRTVFQSGDATMIRLL